MRQRENRRRQVAESTVARRDGEVVLPLAPRMHREDAPGGEQLRQPVRLRIGAVPDEVEADPEVPFEQVHHVEQPRHRGDVVDEDPHAALGADGLQS
ncbi:hypothetical protein AB0L13_16885 [Saccharopolyspora shandongensis]|uniref:hypothetical protein n=1 Tax=Saccharopolyspora shandongensis TaxID=418495 RepID=UPI00343ABA6C